MSLGRTSGCVFLDVADNSMDTATCAAAICKVAKLATSAGIDLQGTMSSSPQIFFADKGFYQKFGAQYGETRIDEKLGQWIKKYYRTASLRSSTDTTPIVFASTLAQELGTAFELFAGRANGSSVSHHVYGHFVEILVLLFSCLVYLYGSISQGDFSELDKELEYGRLVQNKLTKRLLPEPFP